MYICIILFPVVPEAIQTIGFRFYKGTVIQSKAIRLQYGYVIFHFKDWVFDQETWRGLFHFSTF